MHQLCDLKGEDLLGLVDFRVLQGAEAAHLAHRQEGQEGQALFDILIIHIAPVLIEMIGRRFLRIEPEGAGFGFAHLAPVMGQEQLEGAGKGLLIFLLAHQVRAAEHVAPLIITAHFQAAAVAMEQLQEVIALHEHIGELQETEPVFRRHAGLVTIRRKHAVDGKLGTDVPHELNKIQMAQPVPVIHDERLALAEIQETGHLLFDTFHVMVNRFHGQHLTHIRFAGRIADHGRAAAHERDRLMAGPLHMRHGHDRNIMADMQAVRRGIKTDIKGGRGFQLVV